MFFQRLAGGLTVLAGALLASCIIPVDSSNGGLRDGAPCAAHQACESGTCAQGRCRGSLCATSDECNAGWECEDVPTSTGAELHRCIQTCECESCTPCPIGRFCSDGQCAIGDSTPEATFGTDACMAGEPCRLRIDVSGGSGRVVEVRWKFPEETDLVTEQPVAERVFSEPGPRVVEAQVIDANGLTGSAGATIVVCRSDENCPQPD